MTTTLTGAAYGGNSTLSNYALSGLSGTGITFTSVATQFSNDARLYTRAINSGQSLTALKDGYTGAAFLPMVANQACVFVWGSNGPAYVDKAGATIASVANVVCQGAIVPWKASWGLLSTRCPWPLFPDAFTPMAYAVIKAGASVSGNWVFGTQTFDTSTGVVIDPAVNILQLPPSEPITA